MSSGNSFKLILYKIAFSLLIVVAVLGLIMRSAIFTVLPLPYYNFLHAHSHTALLGWAFLMACCSIIHLNDLKINPFKLLFKIVILSIAGMFLSFLYQSYGAISISFSTLFIISTYILLFRLYKRLPKSLTSKFYKRGILWFYLSTIGIWILGPTSVILGKDHWLYNTAILFFLHFQINGWLFYVAMGIMFNHSSTMKILSVGHRTLKRILPILDVSLILSFCPIMYWVTPYKIFILLNGIGVLLMAYSHLHIIKSLNIKGTIRSKDYLIKIISFFLILRVCSHIISVQPTFLSDLATNRSLIIAYLHLVLLGIVSLSFIYHSSKINLLPMRHVKWGIYLFLLGFVGMEMILMFQGLFQQAIRYHYEFLWAFTFVLLIGILIIALSVLRIKKVAQMSDL